MKTPGATKSSVVPDWMQLLAAAVVQQAICDACDPTVSPAVRLDARRFLSGGPDYRFWGQVVEGRRVNGHRVHGRRSHGSNGRIGLA